MDKVVIVYLVLSILLYLLLGGADFGAGIIEMFTSPKNIRRTRKTLYHAIGPIWEANHMWLIIAIVILFVGFPGIYSILSVHLHVPLVIMLMGIIARGTAFTFRHYDAVHDSPIPLRSDSWPTIAGQRDRRVSSRYWTNSSSHRT